jgi:sugar phosphate isomerase/epimerase
MKLSIVLSTQPTKFEGLAYKGEWERHAERMAGLGYDGVELAVRDPCALDASHVQQFVDGLGLTVPAIGTGQAYVEQGLSFTDPDQDVRHRAVARIKQHIELARSLDWHSAPQQQGAFVIIGLIRGTLQKGTARETALGWLTKALSECAQHASPDVKLVIEPLNRYESNLINTVAEGLELIGHIGAKNVGLLLDTFHANIEEASLERAMRDASDKLWHVHVADSNRRYPGAGHLDFGDLITVLGKVGYNGYLSAEIVPWPDADTSAQRTIKHLRRLQN